MSHDSKAIYWVTSSMIYSQLLCCQTALIINLAGRHARTNSWSHTHDRKRKKEAEGGTQRKIDRQREEIDDRQWVDRYM